MSSTKTTTLPRERTDTKTRRIPPYNVILLNDDHHSQEFVVGVLMKVFGISVERACQLMLEAHTTDRAIIWTGPKEVAELKAEQVLSFHEKRSNGRYLGPLGCEIEPAPGA